MSTLNVCEKAETEISLDIQSMRKMLQVLDSELTRLEALFDERSSRDDLTGVLRRKAFEARATSLLNTAQKSGKPFGLLLLDVDHFKKLNDTFGHQAGDEALRALGKLLRSYESPDIAVCRHGGEEFALAIRGEPAALAEEIRLRVEQLHGRQIVPPFTVSVGIRRVAPTETGLQVPPLLAAADGALYRAKSNGRNRVEIV